MTQDLRVAVVVAMPAGIQEMAARQMGAAMLEAEPEREGPATPAAIQEPVVAQAAVAMAGTQAAAQVVARLPEEVPEVQAMIIQAVAAIRVPIIQVVAVVQAAALVAVTIPVVTAIRVAILEVAVGQAAVIRVAIPVPAVTQAVALPVVATIQRPVVAAVTPYPATRDQEMVVELRAMQVLEMAIMAAVVREEKAMAEKEAMVPMAVITTGPETIITVVGLQAATALAIIPVTHRALAATSVIV